VEADVIRLDDQMTELSVLLPSAQALALIDAAQQQGVSVAHFVRRLVREALADAASSRQFSIN
jgi:hypothetical protein